MGPVLPILFKLWSLLPVPSTSNCPCSQEQGTHHPRACLKCHWCQVAHWPLLAWMLEWGADGKEAWLPGRRGGGQGTPMEGLFVVQVVQALACLVRGGILYHCICFLKSFGGKNQKRLGIILQRGILILMLCCFPCWAIFINTERILLLLKQDPEVSRSAASLMSESQVQSK